MDYFTRYGLEFHPFIKNSKEILVNTSEYREITFRLDYLTRTKGFGLLTGSAGRGKTTALRNWAAGLTPSLYKVCNSAMLIGDAKKADLITSEIVMQAVNDSELG